jgi:deoxycytidylate deaminase
LLGIVTEFDTALPITSIGGFTESVQVNVINLSRRFGVNLARRYGAAILSRRTVLAVGEMARRTGVTGLERRTQVDDLRRFP